MPSSACDIIDEDLHSFPTRRSSDLNKRYFEDVIFPESITATTDLKEAIADREIIVIVIPTVGIRDLTKQLNELITDPKIIVHASKGRSEEHTSELQSRGHLVCRLLLATS